MDGLRPLPDLAKVSDGVLRVMLSMLRSQIVVADDFDAPLLIHWRNEVEDEIYFRIENPWQIGDPDDAATPRGDADSSHLSPSSDEDDGKGQSAVAGSE